MIEGKDYWIKVKEESLLMRFLGWIQFWNPDWMKRYAVTVFRTIYWPKDMSRDKPDLLAHECQHIQDLKKYHVWYLFSYAFALPAFWTFRAHWERRGYEHQLKAWAKAYPGADTKYMEDFMVRNFCTSTYLWMWPNEGAVRKWAQETIRKHEKS